MVHPHKYMHPVVEELMRQWPSNRTVNIVFHGHSVPSGYFATPRVDTFHAYPHLVHRGLNARFPFAVVNSIVSGIGGENSSQGAERFERDVLCYRPDVLSVDYGLNDRSIGLKKAEQAWKYMIEKALSHNVKVLLLTPTWDNSFSESHSEEWTSLIAHTKQIRLMANEYQVGLVDSFAAFENYHVNVGEMSDLLSWYNHPNHKGHEMIASLLLRWFSYI